MRNLLIIIISLTLTSCDFTITEFEIKKVADIPGEIDTLKDNTLLNVLSYSGYDDEKKDVWTQIIAKDSNSKKLFRIIQPQFYTTAITNSMNYRQISSQEIKELSVLSSVNLDEMGNNVETYIKEFNSNDLYEVFSNNNFSNVKVFFNPAFSNLEYQKIPIIIGRLE